MRSGSAQGGSSMTTDVEAGTSAALHAELLTAAGRNRVLTPVALRRLLVGVDKATLVEALSRVAREGVTLPASVAASFGVPAGGPAAPSLPDRPTPAGTPGKAPAAQRPAAPAQEAPGPRFTIELGPDSRLNLAALTVEVLRPDSVLAVMAPSASAAPLSASTVATPSEPAPQPSPRAGSDSADTAFEESASGRPEFNSLKYYRKVIGTFPLLSRQQEAELARAIEAGVLAREKLDESDGKFSPKLRRELELLALLGERACMEFAHSNLRLVMSIAVRYRGRGLDFLDLVQEGNVGMLHAIEKFDHRKGTKFSTYAVQWIWQAITRAIADQSRTIRLPVQAHDAVASLRRAAGDLALNSPLDDLPAVAARVGTPVEDARTLLSRVRGTVPLEALVEAIGDDALHEEFDRTTRRPEGIGDEPDYLGLSPDEVRRVVNHLSPREARVLALRHGLEDGGPGLTLDAIGQDLGVTRERVRQIEKVATGVLRDLVVAYKMSGSVLPARPAEPYRERTRPAGPKATSVAPKSAPPESTVRPQGAAPAATSAPAAFTSERHRVGSSGHITVEGQKINLGARLARGTVVVLVEETLLRIIHDGRQVTSVTRRPVGGGDTT
ncbi:RNA polymerase sigma factor RpoD/SigA [Streptomyces sp. NPDC001930]|uniref:sigma-70 family RNA polymerase sigma factor n=1 Tax=Streptomyces sp. NPDC001930 TaxID=3364625 RepID=UPI0036AA275C